MRSKRTRAVLRRPSIVPLPDYCPRALQAAVPLMCARRSVGTQEQRKSSAPAKRTRECSRTFVPAEGELSSSQRCAGICCHLSSTNAA